MKQFLKIYLWQFLSLITGFGTMFAVTPFLASNQSYFGIYTFVISLSLFLSYADFGFLNAGVKFAGEAFSRNDRKEEEEIFGFLVFIIGSFFSVFGIIVLCFYLNPDAILKGLSTASEISIAKSLFFCFFVTLPITLAHRIVQLIFNIRLHDYKYQRVFSLFNLVKIGLAFLFFRRGEYHIVEYFIFSQALTLVTVIVGVYISKVKYAYNYLNVLKNVKYNRSVYLMTKSLALNSLFLTVSWILYYEIDSLVIGKFVGLQELATFNICLTVMGFARSIYGIFYNPFSVKFNHYIGRGDYASVRLVFNKIVNVGLPFALLPTFVLLLNMESFLLSWVGPAYKDAVLTTTVMYTSYLFAFVSYPTGILMVADQKVKQLYFVGALLPLVYWFGIILVFSQLGLLAFGVFKFVAFLLVAVFYGYYAHSNFGLNWVIVLKSNILAIVGSLSAVLVLHNLSASLLPHQKGGWELVTVASFFVLQVICGMCCFWLLSAKFRALCREVITGALRTSMI